MYFWLLSILVFSKGLAADFSFESSNYPGRFLRHRGYVLWIDPNDNSDLFNKDSTFIERPSLNGDPDYISFESVNYPNFFIRHQSYRLRISSYAHERTELFRQDASFKIVDALNGRDGYVSFESANYPGFYIRHRNYEVWLDTFTDTQLYKDDASFTYNPDECRVGGGYVPAYLSGDPHFRTFNNVGHHFQGNARDDEQQFYLMAPCDPDDTTIQPFRLIGSFREWTRGNIVTTLDDIIIVIYDDDDIYYAFISAAFQKFIKASGSVKRNYHDNVANGIEMNELVEGSNQIGDSSSIVLTNKANAGINHMFYIDVNLPDGCTIQIHMRKEGQIVQTGDRVYLWHYVAVQVPECYKCSNCGLFGDFQTPIGDDSILECNRGSSRRPKRQKRFRRKRIGPARTWHPGPEGWVKEGWTWQVKYADGPVCSDESGSGSGSGGGAGGNDFECPTDLEHDVMAKCQAAYDQQTICCRNIGGGFCTGLLEDCIDDVCQGIVDGVGISTDELVQSLFTDNVEQECAAGATFGPIPKLLYEFEDGLQEQLNGDGKYGLIVKGGARVEDGVLKCQNHGIVINERNLDFKVESHSLEVLVQLDSLSLVGGGVMGVDSTYFDDGTTPYAHAQFDSIVYNEANNRKWFLGSDYFRRTKTSGGNSVESEQGAFLYLVATYNKETRETILYRNGVIDYYYIPSTMFDQNGGVRITFCERHTNAGANDFHGRIRFGAYYDRALSGGEVQVLYSEKVADINGVIYEIVGDEIKVGQRITARQALRSLNGRFIAAMTDGGSIVVYDTQNSNAEKFNQAVGGSHLSLDQLVANAKFALLEDHGELAVYDANDRVIWSSLTPQPNANDEGEEMLPLLDSDNYYKDDNDYNDYNDYKDFNDYTDSTPTTTTSLLTYLMYAIGVLIILNIITMTIFCWNKNNKKPKYKIVSVNSSTDADTDIEERPLKN